MKLTQSAVSRVKQKKDNNENSIKIFQQFDLILKFSPLFIALINLFSVTKLIIFYDHFNINIIDFLEFSEILTAFLDDIATVIFVTIWIVFTVFQYSFIQSQVEILTSRKGGRKRLIIFVIILTILSIIIIYLIIKSVTNYPYFLNRLKYSFHLLGIVLFYILIERFLVRISLISTGTKNKRLVQSCVRYVFSIFVIFAIVYTLSKREYLDVFSNKKFINVSFKLDSKLIQSDSTHYYIGKSNKYLFYYDQKKDRTTVYPMNRIKEITF